MFLVFFNTFLFLLKNTLALCQILLGKQKRHEKSTQTNRQYVVIQLVIHDTIRQQ